jgi:hypothetical protein
MAVRLSALRTRRSLLPRNIILFMFAPFLPDNHTFSPFNYGWVLQSTPLPALASQHTICWMYLYSLQINWEIKKLVLISVEDKIFASRTWVVNTANVKSRNYSLFWASSTYLNPQNLPFLHSFYCYPPISLSVFSNCCFLTSFSIKKFVFMSLGLSVLSSKEPSRCSYCQQPRGQMTCLCHAITS